MNKVEGPTQPDFKTYNKTMVVRRVRHQCQGQEIHQWNRIDISEIEMHINGQLIFDKSANAITRVISQQMILGQLNICTNMKLNSALHHTQKMNSKWIVHPTVKCKKKKKKREKIIG